MSGTTQRGLSLKPHSQALNAVKHTACVSGFVLGGLVVGCFALTANAASSGSPPLEVITLSDKGLLPPAASSEDKSDLKPVTSTSAVVRASNANKELHSDSGALRADAPFPNKKAPAAPAAAATRAATNVAQPATYLVKSGDTLDKVVQKALGDSPLKSDILKREIAALNPDAFSKGSQKILKTGVLLKLPNNDDLLRNQLGQTSRANGSNKQFVGYETYPDVVLNPQGLERRKSWVQYP